VTGQDPGGATRATDQAHQLEDFLSQLEVGHNVFSLLNAYAARTRDDQVPDLVHLPH
jgi:hypothetical protein